MTDEEPNVGALFDLSASPGAAHRITTEQARQMVEGAIERAERAAPVVPRTRWLRAVALAALILLVAGAAAAAVLTVTRPFAEPEPAPTPDVTPDVAPPAPEPPRHRHTETEVAPVPEETVQIAEPVDSPRSASAEDLVARANALRGEHRWADAERTYRRVMHEHAGSEPAYVATLAAADLRLRQLHDPREALRLYRAALSARPNGTLDAEARLGVANAFEALGDDANEATALDAFLTAYPTHPLAARARERRAALTP